ncbi:uncharacterized protein LOC119724062 [Patiria miniata]|uniref:GPS domain-containing protein n=1 Tax=Patiria miniata TaxID=46514 RepID=A0A913ZIM6_PATMI|nr:uncharacterized protein LOC119724062 [Patiria miniata]
MVRTRRRDEGRTGVMLVMLLVLIAQLPSVLGQPGYLGCYVDKSDDRALQGDHWTDVSAQSWEWCIANCSRKSYRFMGLESGNECYCGDDVYSRHGNGYGCNMTCEGNAGQTCGGLNLIQVYRVSSGVCSNPYKQPSHGSYHVEYRPYNYDLGNLEYVDARLRYTCDSGYYFPVQPPIVTCVTGDPSSWDPSYANCRACTSISHCVAGQLNCTTATDQQCDQCDGDYGSNGAAYSSVNNGNECRKQCSWRKDSNACYPGSCTDANCACSSGFLGPDCMTLGSGQAPVLSEHSATLEGSTTLESPVVNGSTDTVYTNVRDFARIKIYWESSYQPVGLPNSSAGGHPYIHNVSLGVVWARVEAYVNRSTTLTYSIAEQNCSTTTDGVYFSPDNPAAILVVCEHTFNVNYSSWTPVTGDVLRYDVHSTNGGYLNLYDRDSNNTIITRYYNGQTVSGYSTFTFDFVDPHHCVDVGSGCRTTMLNAGSDVTSQATMTITWRGWADDLAGIKEYNLEVRQLSGNHGNEMTEILDIPAVYSGVTNSSQNVTLRHDGVSTGVYSIVLTTVDNAGNFRLSRRFVFFDDDPDDVTMQNNASVRLLSATEETDYEWLIDLDSSGGMTSVVLDWTNRFINIHHLNQGFLKPIGSYVNATIDDDYDQNFGQRGRAAVPNALGVTEFRVFYDIDHSGGRTTVNVSDDNSDNWSNEATNTQATYNLALVDGDSIRFWVEARDIAGHFVRDSVLVHADSSPPTIQDFKLIPGLSGISVECTTFDEHSGANTVKWRLFHVDNGTEMEHVSETTPVEHIDPEGCNPATCLCVPIGDCYAKNYNSSFVVDDRAFEYFITLTVTNHAGLVTSQTFKTSPMNTVDEAAEDLVSQSNDTSSIDAGAFDQIADQLDDIVNSQDTSPEVTANVIIVVNNLLQVDTREFNDSESAANSSSRVVRALERQIWNVLAAGKNISAVTTSVAVVASHFNAGALLNGVVFAALSGGGGSESLADEDIGVFRGSDGDIPLVKVEVSIKLPEEILKLFPTGSAVPISFVMYGNNNLFHSQQADNASSTEFPTAIASRIISASVPNVSISDLPYDSPVVIAFHLKPIQVLSPMESTEQTETCVFWDFILRDGIGDWSPEGCRTDQLTNGRIVCLCDHATNFAVLVNIHGKKFTSLALDIISKAGCIVSIVALVITIVIYSSLRSLRSKTPSRILISFSLSLLCLYLVFVAGIEQTSSRVVCIVVAVLMHYFTLTSMAWMGVEAASMYLKLVRVFNSDVEHFMIKASVVAWGLPSLVIDVILAVDYTVYDNEYSCFLKPGAAFFFGQLLIIGLVFLFNAVIFVLISRKFLCRDKTLQSTANTSKKKQGTTMKRLQNIAAVSLLLGMTWVFGLLSIFEASSFAFQVIFAVCNSLQGLFIFLLFVVRQEKIRASVMARLRGRNRVDANATTASSVSKVISNPEEDKEPGSNELTDDSILSEKYEKDNGAPNSPETAETTYL